MVETANEADGVFDTLYGDVPGSGTFSGTSGLEQDVLLALEKLCDMYNDGDAKYQSEGAFQTIWPHALKWVSFMHPTAGRLHEPFAGLVDTSRAMIAITRVYRILFEVNAGEVAQLREERLHVLQPLLELWLAAPDYAPSWTRGPDATTATHNIILAVYAALHAVAQDGAGEFFVSQLRQIMPTTRGLDRQIVRLMHSIVELPITPTSPRALVMHFGVLAAVLTRYPRTCPFPRSVLKAIVATAHHCLEHEDMKDVACSATALLEALCKVHTDNHTLVRLIEVDILGLILRIESCGLQSPRALVMRFAVALGAVTLNDVLHICTDVSCYIEATRQILASKIHSLLRQRVRPTQILILADLTHLIPDYLYEPYACDHPGVETCARTVIVEVIILLGGASVRRRLPLSYDIHYFLKT
ncbi:hypothetical protein GGG16DRAFT_115662 [Schizophyllum commune]